MVPVLLCRSHRQHDHLPLCHRLIDLWPRQLLVPVLPPHRLRIDLAQLLTPSLTQNLTDSSRGTPRRPRPPRPARRAGYPLVGGRSEGQLTACSASDRADPAAHHPSNSAPTPERRSPIRERRSATERRG